MQLKNKMIKSRKAAEPIMWLLATIVFILIFLLIYSGFITKLFVKSFSGVSEQFDSAGDADKDDVINIADKCPCKSGEIENDGCPYGYEPIDNEDKSCLTKK